MIEIEGIYIEKDILTKPFLCDITQCLGSCCTFYGEYGAPLQDIEVPILENHVELTKPLLSEKSKDWIEEHGTSECVANYPTTVCINHRDCVFVYYEENSKLAMCAIESTYFAGKTTFRKPISCWLFPIRVTSYKDSMYLYYCKIKECSSAVRNGKQKDIKIYQALKEPLISLLGTEWYAKLCKAAANM